MARVAPKKHLGQHFLTDLSIAKRIAESLAGKHTPNVLEIGPGTGVLTDFLINRDLQFHAVDVDKESIDYLKNSYPHQADLFHFGDFLKDDVSGWFDGEYSIIGNFPYNISSQIFFRILQSPAAVPEVVCMLQKEVAERVSSKEGSKAYGILSVLLQAYYEIEYLFTVGREVFNPPPKVLSGVIRLTRQKTELDVDKKLFFHVVKSAFQMRRKTLRNALKGLHLPSDLTQTSLFDKRAEQLSVQQFIDLTKEVSKWST